MRKKNDIMEKKNGADRHALPHGVGIWRAAEGLHERFEAQVRAELYRGGGACAEMRVGLAVVIQ